MDEQTKKDANLHMAVGRQLLLKIMYGIIRDIDLLSPEERNSKFLIQNVKAAMETGLMLARDAGDPGLQLDWEVAERVLDAFLHGSFPIKVKSPPVVPPSSLPTLDEPSGDQ